MLHVFLTWLERNVRVPLKDTFLDQYIMLPLKSRYCSYRRLVDMPLKKQF